MTTVCESQESQPPVESPVKSERRRRRPLHHLVRPRSEADPGESPLATMPRHLLTRGAFAVPILADGSPDQARAGEGFTADIGCDGITFEITRVARPATATWFLGIENDEGELVYSTVKMRETREVGLGLRIDAEFVSEERDPLRPDNLIPRFDPDTFRFRTGLPMETLEQWHALGVMRPRVLDCLLVCPRCRSLPTIRRGCRACASLEVETVQLIHHFACAHVDLVHSFETEHGITCPKCRTRALVVGADFEFLRGPYTCNECGWTDQGLENIARCMACGLEFPEEQGFEQEVIGYYVERLEPLDLVPKH